MRGLHTLVWILSGLLMASACNPRSPTEDADSAGDAGTADSSRVDTLEVLIEGLKNQLETNQKMSVAEREALERELKNAESEKDKAAMETGTPISGTAIPKTTPAPGTTVPGTTPSTAPKIEGPYNFYSVNDCMQPLDPGNPQDGSIFRSQPCNNTMAQQFTLEARDSGYFRLILKMTSKCLMMEGSSPAGEGTPPTMRPCKAVSDNAEQWKFFEAAADGSKFKIQNRLSNLCLKIGPDSNATIFQGSCTNNYTDFSLKKSI